MCVPTFFFFNEQLPISSPSSMNRETSQKINRKQKKESTIRENGVPRNSRQAHISKPNVPSITTSGSDQASSRRPAGAAARSCAAAAGGTPLRRRSTQSPPEAPPPGPPLPGPPTPLPTPAAAGEWSRPETATSTALPVGRTSRKGG
jgi:hypothetical protein